MLSCTASSWMGCRGAADLRIFGSLYRREAEAAFSIEKPWQSLGIGAALLERSLLAARNRGVKARVAHCVEGRACQRLSLPQRDAAEHDRPSPWPGRGMFGRGIGRPYPPANSCLTPSRRGVPQVMGAIALCGRSRKPPPCGSHLKTRRHPHRPPPNNLLPNRPCHYLPASNNQAPPRRSTPRPVRCAGPRDWRTSCG